MANLYPVRVGEWVVVHAPTPSQPLRVTVKHMARHGADVFVNPAHASYQQPGYLPAEAAKQFYSTHNIKEESA